MITAARLQALMYDLPLLIAASRGRRAVSMHVVAATVGISPSTVHRVEGGYSCDVGTLVRLLHWLENE